ncbi:MAG: hypothetical protein ABIO24_10210, partial [Saprospiraceae bacterium]
MGNFLLILVGCGAAWRLAFPITRDFSRGIAKSLKMGFNPAHNPIWVKTQLAFSLFPSVDTPGYRKIV